MGKPDFQVYQGFRKKFFEITKEMGKEQYLVPYLMSSHPGSTLKDALELALCLKRDHYAPEQVQDYYPTPGTASTVMFYTGINPLDMKPVYVATDYHEKQLQRALLQYNRPQNAPLVREALIKLGREDLIGYGPECLVRPEGNKQAPQRNDKSKVQKGNSSTGKSEKGRFQNKNGNRTPNVKKGQKVSSPRVKNGGKPTRKKK
jgi:hypothetical protein